MKILLIHNRYGLSSIDNEDIAHERKLNLMGFKADENNIR